MANTEVGAKVQVEFSSVGQMRKAIKEATSDLIAMQEQFGKTSPQAIAAAKRIAELKDRIEDAKEQADLFDPGKKFQAFATAANQIAAGFSAVQGAMALVGAESEDVQKGLLKVQGALALSQGLSQLGDLEKSFSALNTMIAESSILQKANAAATTLTSGAMRALGISVNTTSTSFKVLRTAIIATGIGALVVAIGFAVEALMNLADSTDEATKAEKKLAEQQKRTEEAIKLKNKALQESIEFTDEAAQIAIKRAKLEGKSEDEIVNIQRAALQKKIDLRKKDLETLDTSSAEFFEKKKEYGKALTDLDNFELDQQIQRQEKARQKIEENNKKADKKREDDDKIRQEAAKVQDDARRALLTDRQREEEDALRLFEQNKEILKKAGVTNFLNIELQYQKSLRDIRIKYETEEKERLAKEQKEKEEKDKERQSKDLANKQAEFDRVRQQALDQNAALVAAEIELQNAKFEAASAGLNALGILAGENERLANIFFAIDKALAIAKIVVDTQREIAGYYAANALGGPIGMAIASKQALIAKIRAGISIATIAATTVAKFRSGGTGAASAAAPMAGGGGAPVAAQPSPTVTATAVNTQAVNNLGNQAMRAYVLNSDITNNEQRNAYLQRNARLG